MWTSSLRLRGGVLGTGACLAALACAANGWAAGGTPMPAPDDPPPAYRTSTVKTSASRTTPTAPTTKRVADSAPAVPTPDAPVSAASTTTSTAPTAKQAAVRRARSLARRGVGIVHPEDLARDDARTSLDVRCTGTAPKPKAKPKPKAQQKAVVTKAKRAACPFPTPGPGTPCGSVCRSERSPPARPG